MTNGIDSSKNYDKLDDFNFEIVNFNISWQRCSSLPSNSVCLSQLIRFSIVCLNVDDFNNKLIFDC